MFSLLLYGQDNIQETLVKWFQDIVEKPLTSDLERNTIEEDTIQTQELACKPRLET